MRACRIRKKKPGQKAATFDRAEPNLSLRTCDRVQTDIIRPYSGSQGEMWRGKNRDIFFRHVAAIDFRERSDADYFRLEGGSSAKLQRLFRARKYSGCPEPLHDAVVAIAESRPGCRYAAKEFAREAGHKFVDRLWLHFYCTGRVPQRMAVIACLARSGFAALLREAGAEHLCVRIARITDWPTRADRQEVQHVGNS